MLFLEKIVPGIFGLGINFARSHDSLALLVACGILCAVIAYLLGSLNASIIASKALFNDDVRNHGSGNAGLTNMTRVYGKKGAIYTLIGDVLKQVLSILAGILILGSMGAYLAGIFCILGHIFPVYYRFKGGKGVLTAATMILLIDPRVFLVLFIIFAIVLIFTKYVSLASIISAFAYPAAVRFVTDSEMFSVIFAMIVGIIVIAMHRTNIYRLFNNEESKFSFKKKPDTQKIMNLEDKENDPADLISYEPKKRKKKGKK